MDNNNNIKKEKYKCLYTNKNPLQKDNKYIQSSKFISNNSFLIFKDKKIIKYNYSYNLQMNNIDSIDIENEFIEKDYIYDYDIIFNQYESNTNICICAKDNPIRILNDKLLLIKSFSIENKQKESYLSSIFIKYEPFGLNIYTGKNHLTKIDLIKQKEINTIYNKNYNHLSCFDFNIKYSCYFIGSYSNKLFLCDYKTDKIINIYKQEKSVNQIKVLNTKEYKIIVGYRNSDYICLFDIRKMDKYIQKLNRNAMTTKKINFILDKDEKNLYSGTKNGTIIRYCNLGENDMGDKTLNENIDSSYNNEIINNEEIDIGINNCISSIDLNNDYNLMLVTNGERNFDDIFYSLKNNDSDYNSDIENEYKESQFHLYKIINE